MFLCRAERVAADPFEAIGGIPVAGAVIVDQPLLVYRRAEGNGCPIWDGDILQKFKIVCAGPSVAVAVMVEVGMAV